MGKLKENVDECRRDSRLYCDNRINIHLKIILWFTWRAAYDTMSLLMARRVI